MMHRVMCGALILLISTIYVTAQSPNPRLLRPAFDTADALIRGSDQQPRPVPLDLDVSVAIWAPTALRPVPFLRLTHVSGGDVTGTLNVWWMPGQVDPTRLLPNSRCRPPGQGPSVCVAAINISEPVDWGSLLVDIVAARVCSMTLTQGGVGMLFDAGDLDVRMDIAGATEAYSCNAPRNSLRAGAREAARVMDVMEKLANDARVR